MTRYVAMQDTVTFGSDPVGVPEVFLDALRATLHPERDTVKAEGMATLGTPSGMVGNYKVTGEIEILPSSDNILKLLKWIFGEWTDYEKDAAEDVYKYVFYPSDVKTFGCIWVMPDVPDDINAKLNISCIPTEMTIEGSIGEPISTTFTILGLKDKKVEAPVIGTISSTRQFFSIDAELEVDGTDTFPLDSFSLHYRRPVVDDFYQMDDPFLQGFILGQPEFSGDIDLLFKDWLAYEKFWGAASAPVAKPAKILLKLTLLGDATTGTGEFANHTLKLELPAVMITNVDDPVEKRDKIIQSMSIDAVNGTIDSVVTMVRLTMICTVASNTF